MGDVCNCNCMSQNRRHVYSNMLRSLIWFKKVTVLFNIDNMIISKNSQSRKCYSRIYFYVLHILRLTFQMATETVTLLKYFNWKILFIKVLIWFIFSFHIQTTHIWCPFLSLKVFPSFIESGNLLEKTSSTIFQNSLF